MTDLRLVIFDVDGTLVDSQADILASMAAAFASEGLAAPGRGEVLSIVGLSLPQAIAVLAPDLDPAARTRMVESYKDNYSALRAASPVDQTSPLYPGIREVLDGLRGIDHVLMGVATGKSRRGLDKLIEGHGLDGYFVTQQVSDHHPSKPHPSMVLTALAETGIDPARAVMVGDTSFDMDMARAAGVTALGVSWGYHGRARLDAAHMVIDSTADLPDALDRLWGMA